MKITDLIFLSGTIYRIGDCQIIFYPTVILIHPESYILCLISLSYYDWKKRNLIEDWWIFHQNFPALVCAESTHLPGIWCQNIIHCSCHIWKKGSYLEIILAEEAQFMSLYCLEACLGHKFISCPHTPTLPICSPALMSSIAAASASWHISV